MTNFGELSETKEADVKIKEIADSVKVEAEAMSGKNYEVFTAVSYRSQLVAGMNYFIKVHVGGDDYVHLRVYENLPDARGGIELSNIQVSKTLQDPIEPF